MSTIEIYTSIEDLPLDDYLDDDNDDSIHGQADQNIVLDAPRALSSSKAPLATYVPFPRVIKLGNVGKDCFAVKRALSHAGYGK